MPIYTKEERAIQMASARRLINDLHTAPCHEALELHRVFATGFIQSVAESGDEGKEMADMLKYELKNFRSTPFNPAL